MTLSNWQYQINGLGALFARGEGCFGMVKDCGSLLAI